MTLNQNVFKLKIYDEKKQDSFPDEQKIKRGVESRIAFYHAYATSQHVLFGRIFCC